jgi:hypothetical protein
MCVPNDMLDRSPASEDMVDGLRMELDDTDAAVDLEELLNDAADDNDDDQPPLGDDGDASDSDAEPDDEPEQGRDADPTLATGAPGSSGQAAPTSSTRDSDTTRMPFGSFRIFRVKIVLTVQLCTLAHCGVRGPRCT